MFARKQSLEATTSLFFIILCVVYNHTMCNYAPGRYCIRGGDHVAALMLWMEIHDRQILCFS